MTSLLTRSEVMKTYAGARDQKVTVLNDISPQAAGRMIVAPMVPAVLQPFALLRLVYGALACSAWRLPARRLV